MIAILSQDVEESTCDVIDWIDYFGGNFVRLNEYELIQSSFSLRYSNIGFSSKISTLKDVRVVWYRRGLGKIDVPNHSFLNQTEQNSLNSFYSNELLEVTSSIVKSRNVKWLTDPLLERKTDKLMHLTKASEIGLLIPETIVTNCKVELMSFAKKFESIIVKPIYNMVYMKIKNKGHLQYTTEITKDFIEDHLEDNFFPCLVQDKIDKHFEIRTFYLDGLCFSMSIFSQVDEQTKGDFRIYNEKDPNRVVPFKLPKDVELKIVKLMKELNISTGSIDIIKTNNNEYVFLEVNPVGQFGMVSLSCNYQLEKIIAQHLITMSNGN